AQQAGAYVLAPGHSGLEFGLYAAPFSRDSDVQVFFVLEVGSHTHVAPAVIYGPAPRLSKKQLKRLRKYHQRLAKLERKRQREAFKRHQKAHRLALKHDLAFEREYFKAERKAIKRARKLERDYERDARRYRVDAR
ncbi:MAG: hypothetical protein GTO28_17820, partial [Gammaproteobacteria bacterium]|nr:hypothetical protein [Gammaproteobacteria bacterium]NIQ28507.1 hypothetical protein [Gammaproteobacteria bacterium]